MTTRTTDARAVPGRRVMFTRYSDLGKPDSAKPGIITGLALNQGGHVRIHLDGQRYTLHVPPHYQGLTYLDEVVPVPELPMGRFQPTAADMLGVWEGVPLSTVGEDGDDLILLTDDRDKAVAAAMAYDREIGVDVNSVDYDAIRAYWAVFEWEPEDATCPWSVRWDASEDDDQAVHIYYLPA